MWKKKIKKEYSAKLFPIFPLKIAKLRDFLIFGKFGHILECAFSSVAVLKLVFFYYLTSGDRMLNPSWDATKWQLLKFGKKKKKKPQNRGFLDLKSNTQNWR